MPFRSCLIWSAVASPSAPASAFATCLRWTGVAGLAAFAGFALALGAFSFGFAASRLPDPPSESTWSASTMSSTCILR